jgi:hypothetical protein
MLKKQTNYQGTRNLVIIDTTMTSTNTITLMMRKITICTEKMKIILTSMRKRTMEIMQGKQIQWWSRTILMFVVFRMPRSFSAKNPFFFFFVQFGGARNLIVDKNLL